MRYLLDTHIVLWLAGEADRVPSAVRAELETAAERVVSSASAMEIAQKTRLGRLPMGDAVIDRWSFLMDQYQALDLPLTVGHMFRAGSLEWHHRDPFDRMLAAQAQLEGLTLVTSDRKLLAYDGIRTLGWK